MKTMILAAALLASVAMPAWANDDNDALTPQAVKVGAFPVCLGHEGLAEQGYANGMSQEPPAPDPIKKCNIDEDRIPAAMDFLVNMYRNFGQAPTWVESHCHAEPAIPRNKWVCIELDGDVVREYR